MKFNDKDINYLLDIMSENIEYPSCPCDHCRDKSKCDECLTDESEEDL